MVGLVLSVATVGCVKTDDPSANQSGMVTLQLSNGTLTTRAVGTNDDTNNEDLIVDAQVFFFDSNANNATVKYSYYTNITDVKETATISIPLTTEQLTSLFPGGNGYVYVIANYGSEITGATTLAALKETTIASTFGTDANDGVQPSFIMDSDLTTVARGTANTITGEVFLTRAAAKVELTVNVAPITQDGKQWIADTANMRLSFNNGVSDGVIDDGSDEGATPASDGTTFDIAGRGFKTVTGEAGSGSFVQSVPFYSYSTKWTTGAENEVYLELAIPWAVKTEGDAEPTYQTFYYQVPVSADKMSLVRNAYYKLTLDVGVLGGLTKPVTVEPSYVVIDWGTNNVNVTLSRPKYLVVDENYVEIFNQNSYSIGYNSSEPVTITVDKIVFNSYRYANTRTVTITRSGTTISPNATLTVNDKYADYSAANDTTNSEVDFSHTMLANTFVPHEIYITVKHTNDTTGTFSEQIVIKQYPPIYIVSDKSNGKVFVNKASSGGVYDDRGSNRGTYLGSIATGVSGSDTGINDNQNMYNVYITSLPASYTNIIGDPRVETGTTLSNIGGLTKYRQARTDVTNIIAPAFKIASSWGKTQPMTYDGAVRRCASYQESGYPAGRWRLPTQAEIEFMQLRVANKDIPSLFNGVDDGNNRDHAYRGYWAADGMAYWPGYGTNGNSLGPAAGFYEPGGDMNTEQSVRCVYDIWYWGEGRVQSALTTAQWGDAKTNDQF